MAIETLQDWNDRLTACGCCAMPGVDFILVRTEAIVCGVGVAGEDDGTGTRHLVRRIDYTGGGFSQSEYSPTFAAVGGGVVIQGVTRTDTDGDPKNFPSTTAYSSPNPTATAYATAQAAIEAALNWDTMGAGTFPGSLRISPSAINSGWELELVYARFRFGNLDYAYPDLTYLKITYDILESPFVGDAFLLSEDNVIEWEGPGSGAYDDPSWYTDWTDLDPPTTEGIRSIVNIRYTHYRSNRYGIKPQTQGATFPAP